jgi:hypothetical protein
MKVAAAIIATAAATLAFPGCKKPDAVGTAPAAAKTGSSPATGPTKEPSLLVGLRRSSYGLPARKADDAWWAARAKEFAARFAGAQPAIVEIVSTYQNDGSTQFEFARPAGDSGAAEHISFRQGAVDHERALALYDREGVKAILQIESGNADVTRCLEIARAAFAAHPCVAGFGVDVEWRFYKETPGKAGRAVTDDEARAWTDTVLSFDPRYTLFLKHWDARYMPPTYRSAGLWFLSDSQQFDSLDGMMADFSAWNRKLAGARVGYQFGYLKDQKWWSRLASPPADIGRRIRADIPACRLLFWVDFTADKVTFGE